MRPRREPLKNPKTDPGTILWLPASDHKSVIVGRPDQAVLVLVSEPTRTLICGITFFKDRTLLQIFPSEHERSLRLYYLPLVPAAPHPDTQEILQTVTTEKPYLPSKRRQSYVMLFDAFVVSPEILEHLYAGTARLTEEAMALVTRKLTDEGRFESSFMALWRGSQRLKDEMLWNKRQVEEYERELAYRKMYDNVSKDARNGENVDENVMWKVLKFIIGIPAFVGEILRELFWVFVVLMVVMGFVIFLLQLVHENFWTIIAGVLILGICRYYKVEIKEFGESLGRDGN